jgi:7-keto-8-aminopelargonate synthetase-like enzyme
MEFLSQIDGPYIMVQSKKMLDFSSCDFLGLSQHPEVKKAAIKYTLKFGVGVPPSPLGSAPQQQLEGKLAQLLGCEAALLFPSFEEAHQLLKNLKATIVSSETGEIEPKKKSASLFCIDDSFMMGVAGENGFGAAAHKTGFDLILGSLSYGAGCSGAYIAGPKKILGAWAPSQPLSYPVLGAIDSALSFIPEMESERKVLEKHHRWLSGQVKDFSAKLLKSPKAVLEFKSDKEAGQARLLFAENQIFLAPAVDQTLYIAMTALHTPDDLDQLAVSLKKISATDLALEMQSLTPTP